jgi:hypothetical protein
VRQDLYAGQGNDVVQVVVHPGGRDHVFDGGPGRNALWLILARPSAGATWNHALIDLAQRRLDADGAIWRFTGLFVHLNLYRGPVTSWTVKGTAQPDKLRTLRGFTGTVIEHGRGGDDALTASNQDDILHGGAGMDQGWAGRGTDACFSIEGPTPDHATTSCNTTTP